MISACNVVPRPYNESVLSYGPGSKEKHELKNALQELSSQQIEIPAIIGGKEIKTGKLAECRSPHNHAHILGRYHQTGEKEVALAVDAALKSREEWSAMPWEARVAVFLKAAELLAGPRRYRLNAANMLDASKTVFQAEIDSACEIIDFFRFNVHYMQDFCRQNPQSAPGIWNYLDLRPLEGFIFAVTPFNFASIAANLPTAPAMLGNVVLWKPASSTVYVAYHIMQLLREAGLPDGVINFLPGPGAAVGDPVLHNPHLAGIHFTGSTPVFQGIWSTVGGNINNYRTYPRIVGETGGKDFVFVHASADVQAVAVALTRGAFEYQGQKCSAASRAYIPQSLWPEIKKRVLEMVDTITVGDPTDFRFFMSAVVDKGAYAKIIDYIEFARSSPEAEIIAGGTYDDSIGYFIQPTIILTTNPKFKTMIEEIFGPVLTIFVYEDKLFEETLHLCDETSPYGLTGSIFSQDRTAINYASGLLRNAAGNFYINDKPTGAVVGQQPFGGSRASGTNDKAGSLLNLLRWVSPRVIKENFNPPHDFRYPYMLEA